MKNDEDRKNRFALSLLLSALVFLVSLLGYLIVAVFVLLGSSSGWGNSFLNVEHPVRYFIITAAISIIIGTLLSAFLGRIPLKSVNHLINVLHRLADGDYKARLSQDSYLCRINDVRKVVQSVNTLAEELDQTEMLRSDFINNFSHEFKTPIVSIAGFAKLLRHGNLTEKEKEEYLAIIEEESLRLSTMATNVLSLTKIENQNILSDVTTFNLSEQIRNCFLLLEDKWERKNLDFVLDFDEYEIDASKELLKQVWINLLDNAIKFTPPNGTIIVSISEEKSDVCVRITNTGSTISSEDQSRIFQKFYQADRSHSSAGNGIGLSIVQQVIRLHSGTVSVESGNDQTSFFVTLPHGKRMEHKKEQSIRVC